MVDAFNTYNEVSLILNNAGATNIKISLPKINPTTGERYDVFGAWYVTKQGNNRVMLVPQIDWNNLSTASKDKIKEIAEIA